MDEEDGRPGPRARQSAQIDAQSGAATKSLRFPPSAILNPIARLAAPSVRAGLRPSSQPIGEAV